jgi:hypothetical protein
VDFLATKPCLSQRCRDVITTLSRGDDSARRFSMSIIDKRRVAAVATLEALGYTYSLAQGWSPPTDRQRSEIFLSTAETDAMHSILVQRADALQGCTEGSPEETELESVVNAIEAYEARRWPDGKEPGGKG